MEQKRYQAVEMEGRYVIVDKGTFPLQPRATPNLTEGEIKIKQLSAKNCPLKVNCIELEGEPEGKVSSICKYLGNYHAIKKFIPCYYKGSTKREIFKLLPDPITHKAKYAVTQFFPQKRALKKSHAYLVCEKRGRSLQESDRKNQIKI